MNTSMQIEGLEVPRGAERMITVNAERHQPRATRALIPVANVRKVDILAQVLSHEVDLIELRGLHLLLGYSTFYPNDESPLPNTGVLMGGILSIICNIVDYRQILSDNTIASALLLAGYNLRIHVINTEDELRAVIQRHPPAQALAARMIHFDKYLTDRYLQLVMVGPILLTLCKNITPDGYSGWMTNRVRTFSGVLAAEGEGFWTDALFPAQGCMKAAYSLFSACHDLRKAMFCMYRSIGSGPSLEAKIFSTAIQLMSGAEMAHISLICSLIFGKYRELTRLKPVRDSMILFRKAFEFLATVPDEDLMYAKILYTKDQTAILNRNNFSVLAQVATSVAQFENKSFKNYRGAQNQVYEGTLGSIVVSYLQLRTNFGLYGILESNSSDLMPMERKRLLEKVDKDREMGEPATSRQAVDNSETVSLGMPPIRPIPQ